MDKKSWLQVEKTLDIYRWRMYSACILSGGVEMVKQKRVNLRIEEDLWQSAVHAAEHESRELGLPISATTIITMGIQR